MMDRIIKDRSHLNFVYARLRLFNRYRDTPHHYEESIAEHQYYVVLLTKMICDKIGAPAVVRLKSLEMALIHDINESASDDFVFSLKYKSGAENFRKSLENVEEGILEEMSEKLGYDDIKELYSEYKRRDTLASKIVKCADWMSVVLFCDTELEMGENVHIRNIKNNAEKRLEPLFKEVFSIDD